LGEELVALADQKHAPIYKAPGMNMQGCVLALTGKAAVAIQLITSGLAANRSRKHSLLEPSFCCPWHLLMLNSANPATLGAPLTKR
jgi:hypothetical protein